jgi:hypothetical protein
VDVGTAVASSWASGISVYLVASILGIAGRFEWIDCPEFLQRPWVIGVALVLAAFEFVVDKISYVDSVWDAVHTVIRPVAGALLLHAADASADPAILAVTGASLALLAHGAKASTRVVVNASPEPVSNVVVSFTEDGIVAGLMTFAVTLPELAFALAVALALASALLILVVVRGGRRLLRGRRDQRPR